VMTTIPRGCHQCLSAERSEWPLDAQEAAREVLVTNAFRRSGASGHGNQ